MVDTMDLLIHIIDDDELVASTLERLVTKRGHRSVVSRSAEEALTKTAELVPDLILLDLSLPDLDGIEVLKRFQKMRVPTPIIMVSGFGTVETAVEALKLGAYDFLTKPLNLTKVHTTIENILTQVRLRKEVQQLRSEQENHFFIQHIMGASPATRECYALAKSAADNDRLNILVTGESGTGKEFLARYVHYSSPRHEKPLVTVNCSALPKELVESELFGYEKGAFTGASTTGKSGRFELAQEGTLFLDEIGDLHGDAQAKILRFLQEREVQRVGGTHTVTLDVRIIAATNQDLEAIIQKGRFREDLYYRLNVMRIHLPPLRERKEDIPLFAHHFINVFNQEFGKKVLGLMPKTEEQILEYSWPGNIRELRNVIERAVHLARGPYLSEEVLGTQSPASSPLPTHDPWDGQLPLRDMERKYVKSVLASVKGNKSQAAEVLGISRARLRRILNGEAASA
jgi:DNA-binding NtrC family response regulator